MMRNETRNPAEDGWPSPMLRGLCLAWFTLGCLAGTGRGAQATAERGSSPSDHDAPASVSIDQIREAAARALPPLQKSLVVYAEKRDCFSCHNQAVPLAALKIARTRGLAIDEEAFEGAVAQTLVDLEGALVPYRKGQ